MRKYVVFIACLIAFYLDTVLFPLTGLRSFAPEALFALFVSLGVLIGGGTTALIGGAVGLLADMLFNKYVGLSSAFFIGAALAGGIFHNKFYADNLIIPSVTAAAVMFVKEHIMLIVILIAGGRLNGYMRTLAAHILPASLLTGGLCVLIHLVLRATLFDPRRRKDVDGR